jgi:hypothetical protein
MDDEEVLGMLDSIDVSTSSSDDEWDDAKEDAEQPQQPQQQQPAAPPAASNSHTGGAGMPGVAPAEGIPPGPRLGPGSLLLEPEPELAPGGSPVPPKAAVWEFDNSAQPWKGQPEKWEAYFPELSHALGARARRFCVWAAGGGGVHSAARVCSCAWCGAVQRRHSTTKEGPTCAWTRRGSST